MTNFNGAPARRAGAALTQRFERERLQDRIALGNNEHEIRRHERLTVLDQVAALIAGDVVAQLANAPDGWPIDEYAAALRDFWIALVAAAVTAGVDRWSAAA